ncbi:MAG: proline dehydrogenase family protein, partial [Rhodospirillaceae bacterium]|nr:proline dehydrogenase family protein [Rhodospirillaceae bacterium]
MADGGGSSVQLRAAMRALTRPDEAAVLDRLMAQARLDAEARGRITARAADLVRTVRKRSSPRLMEVFLAEYGLSTREGVALMCLAEALLRVPDAETIDALIEDKIAPSDWGKHLGHSTSSLVNASTWALMLTGKVLKEEDAKPEGKADGGGVVGALRGAVKRLGEPMIRRAVGQAMKELGRQFVLGRTIDEALKRAQEWEKKGYTYSYDMLGEAARTDADARRYHLSYTQAITALAKVGVGQPRAARPEISVKLSALHPRYETAQRDRVMAELVGRLRSLALLAASVGVGLNVDAEEADRLDLSLDVIEAVVSDPALAGWDGFGIAVQAYGPRALPVINWIYDLAGATKRRLMVRLVKGAYWDTEIKRAQVKGLDGFPVFTRKTTTDISYIACARRLLDGRDRLYPQFATHNAHTAATVLEMAGDDREGFELQRLHGMGESLHAAVKEAEGNRCRIYAPVGAHRDLLAYLVRRLLENGAN